MLDVGLRPLLNKSPLFASGGADSLGEAMAPYVGRSRIELERGAKTLDVCLNLHRLQKTTLCYGKFDQPFKVEIANTVSFLHGFPMRGSARHFNNGNTIVENPGKGAVGGPGPLNLSYSAGFEFVALFISPQSLRSALSALLGWPLAAALQLEKENYGTRSEARVLRGLVHTMIAELDVEDAEPSKLVLAELEQAAMVAFLCGTAHNFSHLLNTPPSSVAPNQLRQVEEYIEANWNQPITIDALSIVANLSARSIFHSFKQFRGYSPMAFVKKVRLNHAREMLAASGQSVTAVAFACGFGNLGHFSADYFRVFGEKPSDTLAKHGLSKFRRRSDL
jgi:AraC-like DNA-binding protein